MFRAFLVRIPIGWRSWSGAIVLHIGLLAVLLSSPIHPANPEPLELVRVQVIQDLIAERLPVDLPEEKTETRPKPAIPPPPLTDPLKRDGQPGEPPPPAPAIRTEPSTPQSDTIPDEKTPPPAVAAPLVDLDAIIVPYPPKNRINPYDFGDPEGSLQTALRLSRCGVLDEDPPSICDTEAGRAIQDAMVAHIKSIPPLEPLNGSPVVSQTVIGAFIARNRKLEDPVRAFTGSVLPGPKEEDGKPGPPTGYDCHLGTTVC